MDSQKRATVYFESDVHRALRLKAAALNRSISDMVNDVVKASLAEDAEGLAAFSDRKEDKSISFDTFVQSLKRCGRIIGSSAKPQLERKSRAYEQGPIVRES